MYSRQTGFPVLQAASLLWAASVAAQNFYVPCKRIDLPLFAIIAVNSKPFSKSPRRCLRKHSACISLQQFQRYRSSIHFELVFVPSERQESTFNLVYTPTQFSPNHLLKRLSLLTCLTKTDQSQLCGLVSGSSVPSHGSHPPVCVPALLMLFLWLSSVA